MKLLKKYWGYIPLLITLLTMIYAYGANQAKRDSTIRQNCTDIVKLQDCDKETVKVLTELKEMQKVQMEFYKLLRPALWKEAELKVKNHNDSIENVNE